MKQWIYGRNTVRELLRNNKNISELVFLKGSRNDDLIMLAKKIKIKYRVSEDKKEFNTLTSGGNHQGVIAVIESYGYSTIEQMLEKIHDKYPLLVMLDGLEDPHNLGAILRTCDAMNVDGVIIGKNRSVGLTSTVAKVSTGAIDYVKVAQVTNLARCLEDLKKQGFWIVGCENEESEDYRCIDFNMPVVVVIGSEGSGISRLVKSKCDFKVVLPMKGHVNSLNASVAAGVLLYQVYNSRHPL
ncbi:23S rRNA (guanosine(2251)-2'-O)-methyltransferase RlmB [Eggerthia catenaformis]|uniref:23S rRNA (guanosine(2251)-2'-O)-methyltransferase RlmB n=1 Tax=Eggerthia catenaformis TaxID=31973 RepID=UPI00047CA935|nr:23S rRNA (guanosine(2251)-2'-O)-methyltransferase RlmB [Eggerthia catenaformis]OUC52323.1 23S rRNA (guanosine(2251)-2'-O)-methyltransferase RlmB [Eggerthia catenaformis]